MSKKFSDVLFYSILILAFASSTGLTYLSYDLRQQSVLLNKLEKEHMHLLDEQKKLLLEKSAYHSFIFLDEKVITPLHLESPKNFHIIEVKK